METVIDRCRRALLEKSVRKEIRKYWNADPPPTQKEIAAIFRKIKRGVPGASDDDVIAALTARIERVKANDAIAVALTEIGERHNALESETLGEMVKRAAKAGDQEAILLLKSGILENRVEY